MANKREEEIMKKFFVAHSSIIKMLDSIFDGNYEENGKDYKKLTRVQFNLLYIIKSMQKATVSDLVNATAKSKSSISITLTKLEKDGFIKRLSAYECKDRRKVYVELTAQGETALEEASITFQEKCKQYYKNLSSTKKKIFENLVDNVYSLCIENKEDNSNEKK